MDYYRSPIKLFLLIRLYLFSMLQYLKYEYDPRMFNFFRPENNFSPSILIFFDENKPIFLLDFIQYNFLCRTLTLEIRFFLKNMVIFFYSDLSLNYKLYLITKNMINFFEA